MHAIPVCLVSYTVLPKLSGKLVICNRYRWRLAFIFQTHSYVQYNVVFTEAYCRDDLYLYELVHSKWPLWMAYTIRNSVPIHFKDLYTVIGLTGYTPTDRSHWLVKWPKVACIPRINFPYSVEFARIEWDVALNQLFLDMQRDLKSPEITIPHQQRNYHNYHNQAYPLPVQPPGRLAGRGCLLDLSVP